MSSRISTKGRSFSKSKSKSKSTSRPKNRENKMSKLKHLSKNKSNEKRQSSKPNKVRTQKAKKLNRRPMGRNQQAQDQQADNHNSLVEKAKLHKLSSEQQLQLLKELHNKIVISPEENLKHVQTMFSLIKTPNIKIVCTSLRVIADIFVNIAPLQPIDIDKLEERTENRITKQEYKVVKFQKMLVSQYERYIKMLKQMHLKTKLQNFKNDKQIFVQFKKCLLECVVKLYRTLWNFNMNKELNELCLKFIKYQECRKFLQEMLMDKNVGVIGVKSRIISGIAKIVRNQQFQKRLPSDIIKIINSTDVDTRYLKKDQQSLNYKKKQLKKKLYRQQAFQKKKQKQKNAQKGTLQLKRKKRQQKVKQKLKIKEEVAKQFAEGQATIQNKQLVRYNSQILQQLFYIYFKILVQKINSIFLKDALDGVLKFVHLINIQLTQSLIQHLNASALVFRDLWKLKKDSDIMQMRILLVFTGQSIINGPLSVYNMDDIKMTTHLYKILKDMNTKQFKVTKQVYRLLCITLDEAFIKRRQLSHEIVGSFVRQIAIFLKQKQNIPKLYLLQLLRNLAYKSGKITRMFEQDNEGFGLNSFNPMCEDPQCSNAINTEIISQLRQIKSKKSKQYQIAINRNIQKLCQQNFQPKDVKQSLYSLLEKQMQDQFF